MIKEVVQCHDLKFKLLYTEAQVMKEVERVASQINRHLWKLVEAEPDARILVLGVLTGAFMFHSEIVKRIQMPVEVDFVRCKSYEGEVSQQLKINNDFDWQKLKGAHVLVIDDICDTGKTLALLAKQLSTKGAKQVQTAVLVIRPDKKHEIKPDYYGLTCSEFIVGFGLDYNQKGRQYPMIYQKMDA